MSELNSFASNVYSQNGEDGIVAEILFRLSRKINLDLWCCEFGAWDGIHLSNTAKLIKESGYSAVLIEGDPVRVKGLEFNFPGDAIIKVCSFVNPSGENSLDKILGRTSIPHDFDFLSVDIDGMDYWVLKSLNEYKPKVICIEFNPSIPNPVYFVQANDPSIKHGSSARALKELGESIGYLSIAATQCNLLMVREDLAKIVSQDKPTIEQLVLGGNDPQYIFCGYDGTVLSNKNHVALAWHNVFPLTSLQILPKYLRKYGGDYNAIEKIVFRIFYFFSKNKKFSLIINKIKNP